ncbi:type IX secretion system membrane protein PorP/SprF [Cytophagaceae bacterium ABcell3]|nr:type IX secretion system membrane protein PorP/SprF [Cytophagaceae bacterium ABcell3]
MAKSTKAIKAPLLMFSILFCALCQHLHAQDIQFSQFYATPLYQNPAFAGSAHATRFILHQRLQWPSLDARYITSMFSADHYFEKQRSGVGIIAFRDWQGASIINSSHIGLQYAYELPISEKLTFRAGLEASFVSRSLNYALLTFPDQYSVAGFLDNPTNEPLDGSSVTYADLSSGGILYHENFWVGLSAHHMNTPNQSFYGDLSNLPVKWAVTGGYKIVLRKNQSTASLEEKTFSITPTFHYKTQGRSDQTDIGLYALYDNIIAGVWYRGIPYLKRYREYLHNNESMVVLLGFKIDNLSISYSYDVTVSKLAGAQTGGSHEINLTYLTDWPPRRGKPRRKLPCPRF